MILLVSNMQWYSLNYRRYHARASGAGECVHLRAEAVPGGGWEWLIWPAESSMCDRYRIVASAESAMMAVKRISAWPNRSEPQP
jgi:hypothetical protein